MNRRSFIRIALATSATGIIAPELVLASSSAHTKSPMAGGVYYTKQSPGRWAKKVGGHLPNIEHNKGVIRVVTGHDMKGFEHYIVKHMLLNKDFEFIDEKMFNPMTDKAPISTFQLKDYKGPLYAISVCNKHDSWMNVIEV